MGVFKDKFDAIFTKSNDGDYRKDNHCPKCGGQADTKYVRRGDGNEYMKRTCDNCGYIWRENCLTMG